MERSKFPNRLPDVNCSTGRNYSSIRDQTLDALFMDAFSTTGFLQVNKTLIQKLGFVDGGILSNYIDKHRYWAQRANYDGWFFLLYEDQQKELNISDYALRQARKRFLELGFLSMEKKGIPAKDYYKLNLATIINFMYGKEGTPIQDSLDPSIQALAISGGLFNKTKDNKTKEEYSSDSPSNGYITPSMFEDFWKAYPKKVDKGKALTAWKKICQKGKDRPAWKEIKKAILRQMKSDRWQEPMFIPHPTTWLNQSRWLDDPCEMKTFDRTSPADQRDNDISHSYGEEMDHPMHDPGRLPVLKNTFPSKK